MEFMTRLYDTVIEDFISQSFPNGYFVDGVKPELPEGVVELTIIVEKPPQHEDFQELQRRFVVDLEEKTYTITYGIINITQ